MSETVYFIGQRRTCRAFSTRPRRAAMTMIHKLPNWRGIPWLRAVVGMAAPWTKEVPMTDGLTPRPPRRVRGRPFERGRSGNPAGRRGPHVRRRGQLGASTYRLVFAVDSLHMAGCAIADAIGDCDPPWHGQVDRLSSKLGAESQHQNTLGVRDACCGPARIALLKA